MKSVKLKKIIATAMVTSMISVMVQSGVNAEWKQLTDNGSWVYADDNGVATNWKLIDGLWYNFDSAGVMRTGWINDNGTWYFANTSGEMKTGWVNDNGTWYFTDASGAMKTGWIKDKETWYFTDTSGSMQTGIVEVDGKVYSLASSGEMQTGKVIIDNKEYNFSTSGDAIGELPKVFKAFNSQGLGMTTPSDKPSTSVESSTNPSSSNSSSHNNNNNSNSGNNNSNSGNNNEESKWNLVWSDEFNGSNLDAQKWDYQIGNGTEYGAVDWGNNEKEYYTNNNTKVEDGNLIIEARKEADTEQFGGKKYSSARIRTLGKYSKTYGKIEAAITMPAGQGLWPAFWMLPDDNDVYGKWASGGEIDIMEAKGGHPNNVWGTIHFGKEWPNNTSSGSHYTFPEGKDISGKHIYSVEWEPGEIRWYVDGELYYTANNWFSQGNDQPSPYAYPAPFDRDFHMILNLAVGGAYDGNVEPDESFKSAQMKVDYVRVYDLNGKYPVHENPASNTGELKGSRTPLDNGSYVLDPTFKHIKETNAEDLSFDNWNLLTASGGEATFKNDNGLDIDIKKGGTVNYGIQLVDHVPLRLNKKYTLKFKAKADKNATVEAQFGGGSDRGYAKYSDTFKVNLTNEEKEYEYSFVMKDTPNVHGRLEFNLGLTDNVNLNITDVEVMQSEPDVVSDEDTSTAKAPLANGNHIYNGSFNLGDNRIGFWDFTGKGATFESDKVKSEAVITIPTAGTKDSVVLSQKGTNLLQSDIYKLKFKARASKDRSIDVRFASKDGKTTYNKNTFNLTTTNTDYEYEFTMPNGITDEESITQFLMGDNTGTVYIDDIVLIRTTNNNVNYDGVDLYPIKNGDFSLGYNYWQTMDNQGGSKADFTTTNDVATIDVKALGTENWNVMLYSNDMKLSKGVNYTLEFDARADESRDIEAKIEENVKYTSYTSKTVSLKPDTQHVTLNFIMPKDDVAQLKFCMGNTSNPKATKVYIDNVSLRVKDAPVKMPATLVQDSTDNTIGNDINIAYAGGDSGWKGSISGISDNGNDIDKRLYTVADDQITLNNSIFTEKGDYNIVVKSNGFDDTKVSQTIKATAGTVNHDNLISNGDFTSELDNWGHYATTPAAATFSITTDDAKAAAIDVTGVGSNPWDVMLFSDDVNLSKDVNYILEFDAWADEARDIVAQIQENVAYSSYASETVSLTPDKQHVAIKFTMLKDDTAQLKFCFGNTTNPALTKVYIDNVSLRVEEV